MNSVDNKSLESRREIKSRNTALTQANVSPNQISILSVVFAAVAGIQLRLVCNLVDRLVAVEFNKKSKVGDLYNEVPDRIADAIIIIGAGLYCQNHDFAMQIAWANVFFATMTAYVRVLGASLNLGHKFLGPMTKQHRMAFFYAFILML